eukprot:3274929-Amphidinium_carterae.4
MLWLCLFPSFLGNCEDGTAWALYAQTSTGQQMAQGTQCQDCYEMWKVAFQYLDWDALASTSKTDKDLKALVSKAKSVRSGNRIPNSLLKGLPQFEVPTDSGDTEMVYALKDETAQERKAKIRKTFAHAATENGKKIGHGEFLEEESAGHISLQSWDDFFEQKLLPRQAGDGQEDGDDADDGGEHDEEDIMLVGPAAVAHRETPVVTPQARMQP